MENVWSLICNKAIIDQRTKMISLIEVVDALNIAEDDMKLLPPDQKEPVAIGPVSLHVVGLWYRSDIDNPEKGKCRYSLLGPDGEELKRQEIEIDLENPISRNIILEFSAFPFIGLGRYQFLIEKLSQDETSWLKIGSLPFLLRKNPKKD